MGRRLGPSLPREAWDGRRLPRASLRCGGGRGTERSVGFEWIVLLGGCLNGCVKAPALRYNEIFVRLPSWKAGTTPNASLRALAVRAPLPGCSAGDKAPSSTGPLPASSPRNGTAACLPSPERKGSSWNRKTSRPPNHAKSRPPRGKLGVLLVGLGAVATTFIAGVENTRRGSGRPIGSLTQMGTIRLGKRTDKRAPLIKDFVPLAELEDLVFGALGPVPRQRLPGRASRRRARPPRAPRADQGLPRGDQAHAGRLRPVLREAARRHEREDGGDQARPRRG